MANVNVQGKNYQKKWDFGGTAAQFDENVIARYVRVRYVNGATLQTSFRTQTALVGS